MTTLPHCTTTCTRSAADISWCATHGADMAQDEARCAAAPAPVARRSDPLPTVLWTPAGPARVTGRRS